MTNEHNFKVGDKVATTQSYTLSVYGQDVTIPIGEEGIVQEVSDNTIDVYFAGYYTLLTIPILNLDPIKPLDRKTSFLRELQALLRKYDARIYDHDDYRLYIDLNIHGEGFERIVYSDTEGEVNADNIMDFDKE